MYVFDTIIKLYWKRQNASHRLPLTRLLLAGTKTGWLCWVEFGFYYRTSGMRVDRIGGMKCAVVVREERENYRHRRHTRRSRRPPHTITMKRRGTEKNEKSILKSIKLWILHNYCMCLFSYPRSLSLSPLLSLTFPLSTAVVLGTLCVPLTMKNDAVVLWSIKKRKRTVNSTTKGGGWWGEEDEEDNDITTNSTQE